MHGADSQKDSSDFPGYHGAVDVKSQENLLCNFILILEFVTNAPISISGVSLRCISNIYDFYLYRIIIIKI